MNIKNIGLTDDAVIKYLSIFIYVILSFGIIISVVTWYFSGDVDFLVMGLFCAAFIAFNSKFKTLHLISLPVISRLDQLKVKILIELLTFFALIVLSVLIRSEPIVMFCVFVVAIVLCVDIIRFRRISKEQKNRDRHQAIGNIN